MAVSTVHHWGDPIAGLREMRRVARRVLELTFNIDEPKWQDRFWLTRDYLPEFADVLAEFPSLAGMIDAIGACAEPVPIPWGCVDGLFEAYWRRPGAYLEDHVRRAMSVWTRVGPEAEQRAVRSLSDDLESGRWAERNSDLADLDAADRPPSAHSLNRAAASVSWRLVDGLPVMWGAVDRTDGATRHAQVDRPRAPLVDLRKLDSVGDLGVAEVRFPGFARTSAGGGHVGRGSPGRQSVGGVSGVPLSVLDGVP
ncbi:hypothetical protein [Streptomyces sp. CB02460]|uniref:hypothetical protein n=1 Tax=Streptomyces sp. CB02460 TaxID=1703941 RepID=UPI000AC0067E|nr:hypothetical protein [Streptomyces sp. CB02460]